MKKILCFWIVAQLIENGYTQTVPIVSATIMNSAEPTVSSPESGDIHWTEDLNWQEVKERAAKERKYIFLDCYTTWCGPCKLMDQNVYNVGFVVDYLNRHFVNVKVQLDKTKNDNPWIQSWYGDAILIGKQYRIEAFPTLIFLSPDGDVVHQAAGYIGPSKFVNMAQEAIQPGKKYYDPYSEYDRLLTHYQQGIMHYDRMWYMIKCARRFDPDVTFKLSEAYQNYITTLNDRQRCKKDIVEFLSANIANRKSKDYNFFIRNSKEIDQVMQRKGYVTALIDKVIYKELVVPFYYEQNKNSKIPMTGEYLSGIEPDYSEADWNKLETMIRQKFDKVAAERNVLASRIEWYQRCWNIDAASRCKLIELKRYPPDLNTQTGLINQYAWNAFQFVSDKKVLKGYIQWMEKIILVRNSSEYFDTYANLLYKIGEKEKAIRWEEKAAEVGKDDGMHYEEVVGKMKRGEPTYGVQLLR
jgi:thioredoxin-related protein